MKYIYENVDLYLAQSYDCPMFQVEIGVSNDFIYCFHVSIVSVIMTFNEELIDFSNTNEHKKPDIF